MSPRVQHLVALTLLVAGGCLRFYDLGGNDFSAQEIARVNAADPRYVSVDGVTVPATLQQPLLSQGLTGLALRGGYDGWRLRLPSAVAGTAAALALWWLTLTVCGPEPALYAAALLAGSPLHLAVSRTVGSEALLSLLVIVTVQAFCWALQAPGETKRWAAATGAALLACLAGDTALLLLAALALSLAAQRRRLAGRARRVLVALILPGLALGVWTFYHRPDAGGSLYHVHPGMAALLQSLALLATGEPTALVPGLVLAGCVVLGALWAEPADRLGVVCSWVTVGVIGILVADWLLQQQLVAPQLSAILPGYVLLAAVGLARVRRAVTPRALQMTVAAAQVGVVGLVLWFNVRGGLASVYAPSAPWREAAAIVSANLRPDDAIAVLLERDSFLFYAPSLERRVPLLPRPSQTPMLFSQPERGWLIVPAAAHLYPGWQTVDKWLRIYPPVDLSPAGGIEVLYVGHVSREVLLQEVAFFELPASTLVRGTLLVDLLVAAGPIPAVLWKVDQVALARDVSLHNPELLKAVAYLAQHGQGGRAASLAYRLASADPDWAEARQTLAAFQPDPEPR